MNRVFCFALLAACFLVGEKSVCGQQVEIELNSPTVDCVSQTIRLEDVAQIRHGKSQLRRQIAKLDLDQLSNDQQRIEISQRLIEYRLLIAGFKSSEFSISGIPQTTVRLLQPHAITRTIENALRQELAKQFGLHPTSLEVSINGAIESAVQQAGLDRTSLTIVPSFPSELPIGNRSIEIVLRDAAGNSLPTVVSAKISVYRDLVIAKQNIARGEMLSADKIEKVRRPIDSSQVRFASYDQAVGKTARNDIQQFALLKTQFVAAAKKTNPASEIIVKRNKRLNVIVKNGPLSVTVKGAIARENGKLGDYIELINPKSKQPIYAQIIDARTAVIE